MRPRQIDITKPLPVVWLKTDEVDQQAQALEGLYKSLTVSKRSSEQVKQKNAELVQSQTRIPLKVCMGEVPIPACRIVDQGKEPDPPFERGPSYIHYVRAFHPFLSLRIGALSLTPAQAEVPYDFEVTEYELDDEDLDFVEEWNSGCPEGVQVAPGDLEVMLNTFDNQAYLLRDKKSVGDLEDKLKMEAVQSVSSNGEEGNGVVVLTEEAVDKLQEFARAEGVDEVLLEYLKMPAEEEAACAICRQAQRVKKKDIGQEGDGAGSAGDSRAEEELHPSAVRTRQQLGRHYVLENGDCYDRSSPLPYRNPEKLLQCAKCLKYAHVRCYLPSWLPATEEDPWLCDYCDDVSSDLTASKSTRCELCHFDEGLLKRVHNSSHKRAHVTCGLFLPETSVGIDGVYGIEDVHPGRWDMVCKICHETGACVQCKARYCRAAYHPMCAHAEHLYMNCRSGTVYCPKHSEEKRANDEAGAGVTSVLSNGKKKKVDVQLLVITPMVKEHSLEKLAGMPGTAVEAAFGYWFRKRQRKGSAIVPRLALMQQEAAERDATKRRRGKKVTLEDQEWVDRLVLLRQDLEKGRILLDMVRRREVTKRDWTVASREIFELYIAHEEQFWGPDQSPAKRDRGRPRQEDSAQLEPQPELDFAERMEHLWKYEPTPLPIEEVEMLFPNRQARQKKTTSTSYYGNGRVRVLERDPDGRFRGSGNSKKSHKKKKTPRRPPTGRPVGRPRKYPLPEPIPPPVVPEVPAVAPSPAVPLRIDSEEIVVDVTNVESDAENSDVDIDGGIDEDAALPVINGGQLFGPDARSPPLMNGVIFANGDGHQHQHQHQHHHHHDLPPEEDVGDVDYLGKRKSARLSGVPLPALKKRRG